MRFVWAVAALVLAALMIGLGIAQRTVFQSERPETVSVVPTRSAPFMVIDSEVLRSLPGTQTVTAEGSSAVFVSYGRASDVAAWLGGTTYNHVTLGTDGETRTEFVTGAAPAEGTPAPVHTPTGSDLWLQEYSDQRRVSVPLQLPAGMSVLVASDGTGIAPAVAIDWPTRAAAPWSGPLLVGGGILLAVGLVLYVLAIRHARRSRGPRRKGPPPLPPTEPITLGGAPDESSPAVDSPVRRALKRRRALLAVPVALVTALVATGCSADSWPQLGTSATPTPTETVIVPQNQQQPAVTQEQAAQIIARVSETVAAADEAKDPALAATRLAGTALATRETNYKLRTGLPEYPALPAIPSQPVEIILPQAYNSWPRTVLAVVKNGDDPTLAPSVMFLTQSDPWSEYKLVYLGSLEASAALPDLAPAYVGATQVPPDSSFLLLPPDQVAAAYADVMTNGEQSAFYNLFDSDADQFRVGVANDRQKRLDSFNQTAATTGTLTFGTTAGTQPPLALATVESGAIVAVSLNETDTVKPTSGDAVIKFDGNDTVKTLTGVAQSSTGVTSTFADQLFFYVPGQGSTEKIRLIGYQSHILDAKVIS